MQAERSARRNYGSGSIIERSGNYYGKWRVDGQQVMRKIGKIRTPATKDGLTKTQAEARLRALIGETATPAPTERLTVNEAAERLLGHLDAMGRKPTTLRKYRSNLKALIGPRIGDQALAKVSREQVERFRDSCVRDGFSAKYVKNALGFLNSVFEYAVRHGWANANPCRYVDAPRTVESDTAIRFLDPAEVEALLAVIPDTRRGRATRALYLAAVMTGMRQGELLALRWRDVDWASQRIRVSRNYVEGNYGTPKSRRGRSVPLADVLGGELDRLYQESPFVGDDDLVFGNPHTGGPRHGHRVTATFHEKLELAGLRKVRFHDLRHTFGTRMAAAGVPMRTLQEWMGHQDFRTTLIYADYAPGTHEVALVNDAFASTNPSTNLNAIQANSEQLEPREALQTL